MVTLIIISLIATIECNISGDAVECHRLTSNIGHLLIGAELLFEAGIFSILRIKKRKE